MNKKNIPFKEVIEEVGAYIGDLSLIRILTFYELYKLIEIYQDILLRWEFSKVLEVFFCKINEDI